MESANHSKQDMSGAGWRSLVDFELAKSTARRLAELLHVTYGLQELIRRWGRDQLTSEQAIGQILLLLVELDKRLQKLERRRESPPKQPPRKTNP
jgi:hypothetical protein